ncbi:hypothetical protein MXF26_07895 [Pantoea dispersa]|uniref:hypothetical protein n=1 Tax=Pantoea dispersa TaxID=59814 RepID=UPI002DB85444|nr:hypothetical protein [Pantoea dispersa]MEB5836181.1 hypothetical protein [Pantoea dispersa]
MYVKKLATFLILLFFIIMGCAISYHKAPFAFGSGDHTLFHAFGHWIANGEVFTKDFIHFRTPGPYYYYGIMQHFFGQTFLITSTSLLMEAHVFQMVASFFLTLVITKAIWGKYSLSMATAIGLFFLAAPPIYQLRTALPVISLSFYILSFTASQQLKNNIYIICSGMALGLSFWFGQELFIFLSISIIVAEFSAGNSHPTKDRVIRILILGSLALLVVISGLLYFYFKGVELKTFLYNTLYYAFFIQPTGMDTPFPSFDKSSLIYYIWIFYFISSVTILSLSKQLYSPVGIVFTAYTSLRLISMFGRVDILHLMFSISEIVIMGMISLKLLVSCLNKINKKIIISTFFISSVTIFVICVAINGKSSFLLVLPFVFAVMSYYAHTNIDKEKNISYLNPMFAIIGLSIAIFALYPLSTNAIKFSYNTFLITPKDTFLGVQLSKPTLKEFRDVENIINVENPEIIFSYPIRAEYYALTNKHATRFIEFAMQTTPDDVTGAINDLKIKRPEIVIQDLEQTANLSPILFRLSNFISMNYTPIKILDSNNKLEVYKLKKESPNFIRLFDNVYTYNPDHTYTTAGLRTLDNGSIVPVIASNVGESRFIINESAKSVTLQIYPEPNTSSVGIVTIKRGQNLLTREINIKEGEVRVNVPDGIGKTEILLKSNQSGVPVLWLNPRVELNI